MNRRCAIFFALLISLCSTIPSGYAAAAATPPTYPQECPKGGSTGNPTGSKTFAMDQLSQLQTYFKTVVYCANACYNETVSLSNSHDDSGNPLVKLSVSVKSECSKPDEPSAEKPALGCAKGQTQPTILAHIPAVTVPLLGTLVDASTVGPKSRCNADISNIVGSMVGRYKTSDLTGFKSDLTALNNLPAQAPPIQVPIDVSTVNGSAQLAQELSTGAGISLDQAKQIVQDNPQAAVDAINAIAGGDTGQIQAKLNALHLNPDLADTASLKATMATDNDLPTKAPDQGPSNGNTFANGDSGNTPPTQCGISGMAGGMMYAESACGAHTYQPLSSVQGPYQYLCSTWQHDTIAVGLPQYSDCSYRNDTAITTQVVNGMYDNGGVYQQQYGAMCSSANLTWSSCAYAIHVFGQNGFQNILSAEEVNPGAPAYSLCGYAVSAAACSNNLSIFRNGGTVAGVFGELDRRLGSNAPIVASYVPSSASPVGAIFTSGSSGYYMPYGGSPYANAIPVGYAAPVGYSPIAPISTATQTPTTHATPVQYTGPAPATKPAIAPQPVATLIAQPTTTTRGQSVVLSWSTAGMRTDSCSLTTAGVSLAQGNDGSKRIATNANSPSPMVFLLTCAAVDGTSVQESASVTLQ